MSSGPDDLDWTPDGAPRSRRFGDVYFSLQDGLAESRAVFLAGCGLPEAWAGRRRFTVAELGFGTGLNILALLDLWRRERPADGQLHIFTVEADPLSAAAAARAHAAWPELAELSALLTERWPAATPGFHRVDLPELNAVLDLAVMDAAAALEAWSGPADAWFLDGFAPATNPQMWSDAVLDGVAARSAPGARVATFTVAGAVRRGLADRGFAVAKRPGHGRKRERLEAVAPGAVTEPAPPDRVAIIGAGIAGAAAARALAALGLTPVVIEAEAPGAGASGFPAALVTPRLDAGDAAIAALHAQALERAGQLYRQTPGAVIAEGVLRLEQAARDARRFDRIAEQPLWAEGAMARLDAAELSARLGEPSAVGGLDMRQALTVRPPAILRTWLEGAQIVEGRAARLVTADGRWRVLDGDGRTVVEAGAVVLAAGWGKAALLPQLGLQAVRGQAEWADGFAAPPAATWGGYALPTGAGVLFGATHDRDETDVEVRTADTARNRARLAEALPVLAARLDGHPVHSRAAVRATTADRHPLCGPAPGRPGLWLLGGLGSRGFVLAPLLGEHLAARIAGAPSPLAGGAEALVRPDRPAVSGSGDLG